MSDCDYKKIEDHHDETEKRNSVADKGNSQTNIWCKYIVKIVIISLDSSFYLFKFLNLKL